MSSPEGSPERQLIVGRPLVLQPHGGSVNLAFTQEDDVCDGPGGRPAPTGTVSYGLYSPMSDGFPQSPDGSITSERSQAQLLRSAGPGRGRGPPNASFSINVNSTVKDDVLEKNASVVSHDSLDGGNSNDFEEEHIRKVFLQMIGPFIAAGFGTVAAGLLLDTVVGWENYKAIPELIGLVPTLLGLKGNLEMTLTARLCTAANMGNMDNSVERWRHVTGNLVVTQLQAIAVSFLASIISIAVYAMTQNKFELSNTFVLCASALMTAAVASLLLGLLMCAIVILSRKFRLNPDNVSAPIAASLGDITTLALLSYISWFLYSYRHLRWLAPIIIFVFMAIAPLWAYISCRNTTVRAVLISGWTPVLGAMIISQAAGYILETVNNCYRTMAIYQPVISGVGGNLVVVQTCRMTTFLGRRSQLGSHPPDDNRSCVDPLSTLFGSHYLSRTASLLLMLTVPGHLLFIYVIQLFTSDSVITPVFLVFYLGATLVQVGFLLYVARCMVYSMWRRAIDPDNAAIPLLTALGDLAGIALLALALIFLHGIGDKSSPLDAECISNHTQVAHLITTTPMAKMILLPMRQ
ncbi:solute carrier family 41 member 1-like isoform X1 [Varroa jacobsoni]|uniref:solute carrier family 41 member 1-like isoform X1 n=1 Tax=Varroa jacobsoni TaxID=62625 RepID=UPI000BF2CF06|nr:solute carrier family 41 member 1-like isoform X1 [Varroa jacobsoni]